MRCGSQNRDPPKYSSAFNHTRITMARSLLFSLMQQMVIACSPSAPNDQGLILFMATVAQQLREAREGKNLTVYQVAEFTKVRTDHIRALEEGNFEVFSAPVYIKGFVRTYAALLKMDVPAIMKQLDEELSLSTKHRANPPLTKKEQSAVDVLMFYLSKVNWRVALPVLVVLAIIFSLGAFIRSWKEQQKQDPLARLKPGIYSPTNGRGEELELIPAK